MKILKLRLGNPVLRESEEGITEKLCPRCATWKPQNEYYFQYLKSRGHFKSECRRCISAEQVSRTQAKSRATPRVTLPQQP